MSDLSTPLARLTALLTGLGGAPKVLDRIRSDAAALRYHLRGGSDDSPVMAVILGGTGAGKSTLLNRLVGADASATSFRRTFTAGAVAVAGPEQTIRSDFLAIEHVEAEALPARGRVEALVVAKAGATGLGKAILVDTPDLDGDQPAHHAQADRAFRFADAAVFVVTPEKYQMTELLPYYRLADRYGVSSLFVMNKAEGPEVVEDFSRQLIQRGHARARVFVAARDDAGYQPAAEADLAALRRAIGELSVGPIHEHRAGLGRRAMDLAGRVGDQLLGPMADERAEADRLIAVLEERVAPAAGVDVGPVTQRLQRRMRERSVLYLMGPQRILDRVRQAPGLLARLPRWTWDRVVRGEKPRLDERVDDGADAGAAPDFGGLLSNELGNVQSGIVDSLRSCPAGARWLANDADGYAATQIDGAEAGRIVEEEMADLRDWLNKRWNATPRDTALLMKLLGLLPGGKKLGRLTEAAPYLLTVVVAAHHAMFGHIDLLILGGYSLATWLTERLSDEVSQKSRDANRKIELRFQALIQRQVDRVVGWIDHRAPGALALQELRAATDDLRATGQAWAEGGS